MLGLAERLQFGLPEIASYMLTHDAVARTRSPLFGPERPTYQPQVFGAASPAMHSAFTFSYLA
jgi:hypothetical protein